MKPRRKQAIVALTGFVLAALAYGGGFTFAVFSSQADNTGNRVQTAPDFVPPTVDRSAIAKSAGGTPGYIKQGGLYHVYAEVSDTGNPASGVGVVTADVSNVTTGLTTVPLVAGSYSVGGTSYNYRSAVLTAGVVLSEGSKTYSITATDNDLNGGTQGGFSVIVDNTQPSGSDVQAPNAGTTGRAEAGDAIAYTFSELVEPDSILSGWDGSSTDVVVRLVNGGALGDDVVRIYDAADLLQLPLGTIDLKRSDYVGGLIGIEIARFGATGTASTMSMSGSTVTITLGTHSGQAALTAGASATATWTPSATPTDRAGNLGSTAAANETGSADKEF